VITLPLAIGVTIGLAIFPGYLTAYLVATLILDRPRVIKVPDSPEAWPAVTMLVAAWNEATRLAETLRFLLASDYRGVLRIIVIDDGSTDATAALAQGFRERDERVSLVKAQHGGKAAALNLGLAEVDTQLVGTVDGDTLVLNSALSRLVARYMSSPQEVAAIAGAVLVRNSRSNRVTQLQEWDYFLGIASIKRSQGLWQSTLVAQGSFSIYATAAVREAGGWPVTIGEDIALTWAMLAADRAIAFEPTAVAMTGAPEDLKHLIRQRSRWAFGMIEGLRRYGLNLIGKRNMASHAIGINFMIPWMDLCYTFAFLPGLVLAATGNFMIVGPLTLAVLPINLALSFVMFRMQRGVFEEMGLRVRRNLVGFVMYTLLFQPVMSPVAVYGYSQNIFRRARRW
jgi:biofilm PGA synthesis N-glycosyltransferase PgaC